MPIGTLIQGAIGAFGSKPKVPEFPTLKTEQVQQQAISGNVAALPQAQELAAKANLFNQEQLNALAELASPGRASLREKERSVIESFLGGVIPKDVQSQVLTRANARAQAGGFGGSGMAGKLGARDLGLTSLDLISKGIDSASRWLAQSQQAPLMDVSSMFITPQQKLSFDFQQNLAKHQRNLTAAQVDAAPSPFQAALGKSIGDIFQTFTDIGLEELGHRTFRKPQSFGVSGGSVGLG